MSSNKATIGVDIIKSGGESLKDYVYAIAIVKDGNVVKVDETSLSKLIRILWEYRPAILATDNIYELGGSSRNMVKVLKLLPPDLDIVQVTLDESRFASVNELISKAGISIDQLHKLNPMRTAIALALLASKGFGRKLELYEKKVKIIVSKGRGGFAGGSRSDKYQRNMRAAVARVVKKIKEELDKHGIDYDLTIRRSMGGIDRAVFTVYVNREKLYGVISRLRGYDVKVIIKPVINSKFIKLSKSTESKRYLIVGYDPGIESGLAIIDLDSRPVFITSGKELDRSEVLSIISRFGIATIIATDKTPVPDVVKKLAAALNAQLYIPPHSLSTAEKELIVKDYVQKYGITIRNSHERDALAAALKAYKSFEQKMNKLQERITLMGLKVRNLQEYKLKLIKNEPLSKIIEDIIMYNIERESRGKSSEVRHEVLKELISEALSKRDEVRDKERKIKQLSEKINELEKENVFLRERIRELESKLRDYEYKLNITVSELSKDVFRDRKINELIHRLNNLAKYVEELRNENEKLKESLLKVHNLLHDISCGKVRIVKIVRLSDISKLKEITDDVIYVDLPKGISCNNIDTDIINKLKSVKTGVLISQGLNDLAECLREHYLLPIKTVSNVHGTYRDIILVSNEDIKELVKIKKYIQELELKKRKEQELTEEKLESIIESYRASRFKEFSKDKLT